MITPYPMYPQQGYPQYPVQMPTQNNAYPTQMNVGATQQNVNPNVGTPQIQDGGFVIIPDEKDVLTYPVQPGHCVRFKVVGKPIPYKIMPRRPGDIDECYADPSYAYEVLGFKAEKTLDDMCRDAMRWQERNPNGF